jgi:hypothetical protein
MVKFIVPSFHRNCTSAFGLYLICVPYGVKTITTFDRRTIVNMICFAFVILKPWYTRNMIFSTIGYRARLLWWERFTPDILSGQFNKTPNSCAKNGLVCGFL